MAGLETLDFNQKLEDLGLILYSPTKGVFDTIYQSAYDS